MSYTQERFLSLSLSYTYMLYIIRRHFIYKRNTPGAVPLKTIVDIKIITRFDDDSTVRHLYSSVLLFCTFIFSLIFFFFFKEKTTKKSKKYFPCFLFLLLQILLPFFYFSSLCVLFITVFNFSLHFIIVTFKIIAFHICFFQR